MVAPPFYAVSHEVAADRQSIAFQWSGPSAEHFVSPMYEQKERAKRNGSTVRISQYSKLPWKVVCIAIYRCRALADRAKLCDMHFLV